MEICPITGTDLTEKSSEETALLLARNAIDADQVSESREEARFLALDMTNAAFDIADEHISMQHYPIIWDMLQGYIAKAQKKYGFQS